MRWQRGPSPLLRKRQCDDENLALARKVLASPTDYAPYLIKWSKAVIERLSGPTKISVNEAEQLKLF